MTTTKETILSLLEKLPAPDGMGTYAGVRREIETILDGLSADEDRDPDDDGPNEAEYSEWAEAMKRDDRVYSFLEDLPAIAKPLSRTECVTVFPDGASIFFEVLDRAVNGEPECCNPNEGDPLEILSDLDALDQGVIVRAALLATDSLIELQNEVEKRLRP